MAFTTVAGSNGVTSLVGTTGVDSATIVTLESNVFIGGNTGDDIVNLTLGTAGQNASGYEVRMGGGDDNFQLNNTLLNSFIELDGLTAANAGEDIFDGNDGVNDRLVINSEIRGMGGNDNLTNLALNGSTVNGNAGDDTIDVAASDSSFVYGGQGTDTITTSGNGGAMMINGNKGSDIITLNGFSYTGTVHGGNGNDTISAAAVTAAGGGALAVTATGVTINGDLGVDNIIGSNGVDTIDGGDANDTIDGGTGADTITGGAGDDVIEGGMGADTITGGSGADVFTYATRADLNRSELTANDSNVGFDTITDAAWNTAAGAPFNGDRLNVADPTVAINAIAAPVAGGANLAATLTATFGALAVDAVGTVTINGGNSFDGNYIVINDGTIGYVFNDDAVIKVNTLGGFATTALF